MKKAAATKSGLREEEWEERKKKVGRKKPRSRFARNQAWVFRDPILGLRNPDPGL